MNKKQIILKLRDCRRMKTQSEIDNFTNYFRQLLRLQREDDFMLPLLLEIFDDECEQHEVMIDLVKLVEMYHASDREYYIRTLTIMTPFLIKSSEWWLRHLYPPIFHEVEDSAILVQSINNTPVAIRLLILDFLYRMAEKYFGTELHEKARNVLGKVNTEE